MKAISTRGSRVLLQRPVVKICGSSCLDLAISELSRRPRTVALCTHYAKPHETMGAFFSSFGGETTTPPKAKAAAKSKKVAKKATVQKKPAAKAKSPAKAKPAAKAKSPRQQDEDAPPPAAGAESARLEFVGANAANESGESSKFWQMTLSGAHTYVVNGRIGTDRKSVV